MLVFYFKRMLQPTQLLLSNYTWTLGTYAVNLEIVISEEKDIYYYTLYFTILYIIHFQIWTSLDLEESVGIGEILSEIVWVLTIKI